MYPFTSLFKNTASHFYSLRNKLDNAAESSHEFWLQNLNLVLMTISTQLNPNNEFDYNWEKKKHDMSKLLNRC